jgi:hypothetical protein
MKIMQRPNPEPARAAGKMSTRRSLIPQRGDLPYGFPENHQQLQASVPVTSCVQGGNEPPPPSPPSR